MKEIEWNWKCLSFISGISKCLIWETNKKLYSKKWTIQQKNQSTKNQCLLSVKCCPRLLSPFQTFNGQITKEIY